MKMFHAVVFVISAIFVIICVNDDLHVATITKTSSTICVKSPNFFIESCQIIRLPFLVGSLEVKEVQESESNQKVYEVHIETFIN